MEFPQRHAARWVEHMARLGYAAKALLYATIAILAGKVALGAGGKPTDTNGAMKAILSAPFGRVLLALCGVGLVGYAVWRAVSAVTDAEDRGRDLKGIAIRASFIARAVIHLALAWSAIRIVLGFTAVSSRKQELLPAGSWPILLVGIGVGGYGIYQVYRGLAAKLSKQLDNRHMSEEAGHWVFPVSRFGIAARGLVFCLIGLMTVRAALNGAARQTDGLRESLQMLRGVGKIPLAIVAAGLLAYAFYEALNARYRRIRAI